MTWSELHPLVHEALRTTLAVGVLTLLVLVIRRPFARRFGAKAAYALWLLPLIRFALPPLPANWSLSGWLGFGTTSNPEQPVMVDPFVLANTTNVEVLPPTAVLPELPMVAVVTRPDASTSLFSAMLEHLPLTLVSVWLAGTLLFMVRSIFQQRQFLQLIDSDSEPASEMIVSQAQEMGRQLGLKRMPDIRQSLLCSGPLVTGLVKPVVLLPMWFEEDYTADEQRDAIVHELTHLRRRDLWAFQIARLIAATQWFNPLAHLALGAFRTDQESACDADVLSQARISPAAYGRTLVKAARLARPSDRRIAAASLTLAHPIKERLIMMQHPTPTFRSRLLGTALVTALSATAIFATASCMSSAVADETESTSFSWTSHPDDDDNRQMILLGDPFASMHPKLTAIGEMNFDDFDMEFDLSMDDLNLDMEELNVALMELEELDFLEHLELSGEDGTDIFILKSGETEEEFEVRIERWAEQVEERAEAMEQRAEEIEKRTHAITVRIENKAAEFEEKQAARAEAMAVKIEQNFGENFEVEMDAAGKAVASLAEQCEARSADDPTPEIVSAVDTFTGETYRALCVNGDRESLMSQSLSDWVAGRSDLSDEEKAAFLERRGQEMRIDISFDGNDEDAHGMHKVTRRQHVIIETDEGELDGAVE